MRCGHQQFPGSSRLGPEGHGRTDALGAGIDIDGPGTWRYDRERGGSGVIGDLLSHGADLVQHVTGQRLTEVSATSDVFIPERPIPTKLGVGHGGLEIGDERGAVENEDWVAALATLSDGAHATLESSRVARGHRSDYARFQPGPGIPMSFDDLKTIEAAAFLSDVTRGTQQAPNAADGLSAAEVCEAVVRSAASRRWESVPQS